MKNGLWRTKTNFLTKISMEKIQCIETGKIFQSAAEAKRKYGGHIASVANGIRKTAGGFHWKWL